MTENRTTKGNNIKSANGGNAGATSCIPLIVLGEEPPIIAEDQAAEEAVDPEEPTKAESDDRGPPDAATVKPEGAATISAKKVASVLVIMMLGIAGCGYWYHNSARVRWEVTMQNALASAERRVLEQFSAREAPHISEIEDLRQRLAAADSTIKRRSTTERELKDRTEELEQTKRVVDRLRTEVDTLQAEHQSRHDDAKPAPPKQASPNQKLIDKIRSERAWTRLGMYASGELQGLWFFEAPDGFVSPCYRSRGDAISGAERYKNERIRKLK